MVVVLQKGGLKVEVEVVARKRSLVAGAKLPQGGVEFCQKGGTSTGPTWLPHRKQASAKSHT